MNTLHNIAVPAAIIIGFGLVAAAIFFSGAQQQSPTNTATGTLPTPETQDPLENFAPVTEDDHIRGSRDARITFVEYSDYDCPFCKNFHETMNSVMDEYGANGDVAWVYRHFPLEQLHPNAGAIAEAAECVADLGGDDAFWTFSDLVFEDRASNESTDMTKLDDYASQAGVDVAAFTECRESGEVADRVAEDFANAREIGARGTPFTVVVYGDQRGTLDGAQPYQNVKSIIDQLLAEME